MIFISYGNILPLFALFIASKPKNEQINALGKPAGTRPLLKDESKNMRFGPHRNLILLFA